jgi:hypothetical protein
MAPPEVTGRKPMLQGKKARVGALPQPPPSERGSLAYSIPQAGRMIGLSRAASYEAARRGQIPYQEYGKRKIVPRAIWLRRLGIETSADDLETTT